jgi:hypothetical protein
MRSRRSCSCATASGIAGRVGLGEAGGGEDGYARTRLPAEFTAAVVAAPSRSFSRPARPPGGGGGGPRPRVVWLTGHGVRRGRAHQESKPGLKGLFRPVDAKKMCEHGGEEGVRVMLRDHACTPTCLARGRETSW